MRWSQINKVIAQKNYGNTGMLEVRALDCEIEVSLIYLRQETIRAITYQVSKKKQLATNELFRCPVFASNSQEHPLHGGQ